MILWRVPHGITGGWCEKQVGRRAYKGPFLAMEKDIFSSSLDCPVTDPHRKKPDFRCFRPFVFFSKSGQRGLISSISKLEV